MIAFCVLVVITYHANIQPLLTYPYTSNIKKLFFFVVKIFMRGIEYNRTSFWLKYDPIQKINRIRQMFLHI